MKSRLPFRPLIRNGCQMAIARPADPDLAMALADAAGNANAFQAVLHAQPYTFAGIATADGRIIDRAGQKRGRLRTGDSFVDLAELDAIGAVVGAKLQFSPRGVMLAPVVH